MAPENNFFITGWLKFENKSKPPINVTSVILKRQLHWFCYRCNYILIFVGILITLQARCQTDEILLKLIDSEPQKVHDSIYYELFKINRLSNIKQAKHYAKQALRISGLYGDHLLIQVKSCNAMAFLFNKNNQPDSSCIYYHRLIGQCKANGFNDRLVFAYNDLGNLYEQLDVYDSALHYYMVSYNLAIQIQSYKDQAIASHNIGHVYSYLDNYVEAVRYLEQAILIETEHGITEGINIDRMNLARVFNEQGLYTNAIQQLKKIEETCKSGCDDYTLAGLNYGLGYANLKRGSRTKSLDFFMKSMAFARKSDSKQWLANILFHLASFSTGDNNKAITYLQEAEKIAHEINHRRLLRDTYAELSIQYEKSGMIDMGLRYQKLYVQLKDSIFNESVANNIKNIQLGEQRKQSDSIIKKKDNQLWRFHLLTALLTICFLLAFAVVYLVIRLLMKNQKHKKAMEDHVARMLDERESRQKNLFRAEFELDSLTNRVRELLNGPVATLSGLGELVKKAVRPEDYYQCGEMIVSTCNNISVVLENMQEIVFIRSQDVTAEQIDLNTLIAELNTDFKKIDTFVLLNVVIEKSVCQKIYSDKRLLSALIHNAICYFDHMNENPVVEVTIDQIDSEVTTRITVKHFSTSNHLIPHLNRFNQLAVMVIVGKLNGYATVVQHDDYTQFVILIPTDFTASDNKNMAKILF